MGEQRRYWKQKGCYVVAWLRYTDTVEGDVVINKHSRGGSFSFLPRTVCTELALITASFRSGRWGKHVSVSRSSRAKGRVTEPMSARSPRAGSPVVVFEAVWQRWRDGAALLLPLTFCTHKHLCLSACWGKDRAAFLWKAPHPMYNCTKRTSPENMQSVCPQVKAGVSHWLINTFPSCYFIVVYTDPPKFTQIITCL